MFSLPQERFVYTRPRPRLRPDKKCSQKGSFKPVFELKFSSEERKNMDLERSFGPVGDDPTWTIILLLAFTMEKES